MDKDCTWGDGIMLSAASLFYNRPIKILYANASNSINEKSNKEIVIVGNNSNICTTPLHLGYLSVNSLSEIGSSSKSIENQQNCDHYVSLVPVPVTCVNIVTQDVLQTISASGKYNAITVYMLFRGA
jgi:hypothetical protein